MQQLTNSQPPAGAGQPAAVASKISSRRGLRLRQPRMASMTAVPRHSHATSAEISSPKSRTHAHAQSVCLRASIFSTLMLPTRIEEIKCPCLFHTTLALRRAVDSLPSGLSQPVEEPQEPTPGDSMGMLRPCYFSHKIPWPRAQVL